MARRSDPGARIVQARNTSTGGWRGGRNLTGAVFFAAALALVLMGPADAAKQIVGATEIIEIEPSMLRIEARIDSGAKTTSIHAENIEIDPHGDPRGKPIAFDLVNKQGQSQRISTQVVKQLRVKTSEGEELRYAVALTLTWRQTSKTVLVNLNDRAQMRYRLLLGRNWLRGDYLVDVELNDTDATRSNRTNLQEE